MCCRISSRNSLDAKVKDFELNTVLNVSVCVCVSLEEMGGWIMVEWLGVVEGNYFKSVH